MDKKNESFKPYISADKVLPEFTVTSILMGIILAVVFGAANAYLGLKVGMTVSASIPAAVISLGVIRVIMKKNSILESNMVQTIGSAGESLAAGAIFTMPALFLWAEEGKIAMPGYLEITLIALFGGILGVLFMIPLRKALIVEEHGILPYPEGMACAEVLLAGEEGGSNASTVFAGMGLGAAFKFIVDGLKIVPSDIATPNIKGYAGQIGVEIYPALIGVGYICGPSISSYMFAGGIIAWLVLIPAVVFFGGSIDFATLGNTGLAGQTIAEVYEANGASAIWSNVIKYVGAGAIATGGVISLLKSLPLIIKTFAGAMKSLKNTSGGTNVRTDRDLKMPVVLGIILIVIILIWLVPSVPVSLLGAFLIAIFGFFFATVSSRMVGLIGSSNNPVSGMAIATLLISTFVLKATGNTGMAGMTGAIAIGSIICVIAAIAGDTSQDLKTGFIVGATPAKQQVGELIGVVASGFAIAGVMSLLNKAWGFGSAEIPAPQATLMKMIVEGIMDAKLPWVLVFMGVFLALALEVLRVPVMPFAIGLYLPIYLSCGIMVGGVVRLFLDKKKEAEAKKKEMISNGTLYCAGMIAGEGLVGILMAVLAIIKVGDNSIGAIIGGLFNLSGAAGNIVGLIVLALMILSLLKFSVWSKTKSK
ncbi:MAG: oligopeptide transporter, OPT family [Blautia faecicola]|nr:oligopeptide transporter, OPT family [Ruminococcus sp.]MBS6950020.1 oligopeptide transporter, OPT family [Blautia sp.]MBT9845788.1 oligopeptide transporter, OPT family [Blautia sp. MCC289]MCB8597265.1 oligopeptide transporter, OPT family [Blautia sp. DFI.9.9]MCC2197822.1 oligopeptide transporter, OPT family [Oliverpabstia intestinalis]MCC2237147.1 oligopeptide transporter, OPT family [Fusicatenibacter sp. CLA-AA-H213]MCC2775249.1 oligopeptide transporter, OPT family [Blautia sp. DFI.4.84]